MTEVTTPESAPDTARTQRFRIGALVVLALAAALILWLVLRDSGGDSSSEAPQNVSAATASDLQNLAASVKHPVFWLGARNGTHFELTKTSNGSIFVRYLPEDVKVGAKDPYLTVATYPFPGALGALQKVAKDNGTSIVRIANNGIAVPDKRSPQSVHAAYPGVPYQVEVYDPSGGTALQLLSTGQLKAIGSLKATSSSAPSGGTSATAASEADLKALAKSAGHPVYWAGPKDNRTYEQSQTPSGKIYIRYVPKGAKVGTGTPYLTVATYPFPGAFGAIEALSKQNPSGTIELDGGGLAVVDSKYPQSIHLAYPDSDYQVEVFDPAPAVAKRVVSSGQVTEIG